MSDLDVVAIADGPVDGPEALVAPLRHAALPCPARKLELVVYRAEQAAAPSCGLQFELDLNTGPDGDRLLTDPGGEPTHWYLIDLAIARQHGIALAGAAAREVIGEPPRDDVLDALLAGLRWSLEAEPLDPSTVLNACRAWCFAAEGRWLSKAEAARWADTRSAHRDLVQTAGRRDAPVDGGPVVQEAIAAVEAAR